MEFKTTTYVTLQMVKDRACTYKAKYMNTPEKVVKLCQPLVRGCDKEKVIVLCVSQHNEINAINTVSIGTANEAHACPREIFKAVILSNSTGFILVHNHPSGNVQPSTTDIKLTNRIKQAGELMEIAMLDHIILGDEGNYYSFQENNYFK